MDKRTDLQKQVWDLIGPPLYYCSDCMLAVKVKPVEGKEPIIERPCGCDCKCQIIAPRSATAYGEGGMDSLGAIKLLYKRLMSALTGRSV